MGTGRPAGGKDRDSGSAKMVSGQSGVLIGPHTPTCRTPVAVSELKLSQSPVTLNISVTNQVLPEAMMPLALSALAGPALFHLPSGCGTDADGSLISGSSRPSGQSGTESRGRVPMGTALPGTALLVAGRRFGHPGWPPSAVICGGLVSR